MNVVIIIPTLNPKENFQNVVREIKDKFERVVIVNDGSDSSYDEKFNNVKKIGCNIVKHEENKGKGAAIKTGLKTALYLYPECDAVITVDADGQHLLKDIIKVSAKLEEEKEIVFGVRNFNTKNIPFRNKYGNRFSSLFFKIKSGIYFPDTQTGLRGIPKKYFNLLKETEGNRFEYEMNFLTKVVEKKININLVPIEAVYEKKSYTSHFRPVKDSILIYAEQIKYMASSLISALIDIAAFTIISLRINAKLIGTVAIATVAARIISGIFNFLLNKFWAFKSKGSVSKEGVKYLLLFIIQMMLSFLFVYLIGIGGGTLTIIKIIVDFILFIISYVIQKRFIFKEK